MVAQLNCTEEAVAPVACMFEIAKLVGDGVEVCAVLGLTTPAQPDRPKLKIAKLSTTISSRNPRLLAERAAPNIFQSPQSTQSHTREQKTHDCGVSALWRLLSEVIEGNWTQDANECRAGDRVGTGLKG